MATRGLANWHSCRRSNQRGSFSGAERQSLVSIPFNRSTPIALLNADLEEARATPPATWEELATTAARLTRRDSTGGVRWGFEVPVSWWYWVAMVGQAGGELVAPGGTVTLGGTAGEKALAFWQKLVHQDGVMRPPPGRDYQAWQSTNESFLLGRIAMMWNSTAFVRYLEDTAHFPVIAALPGDVRRSVPPAEARSRSRRARRGEARSVGLRTVDVRDGADHRVVDAH